MKISSMTHLSRGMAAILATGVLSSAEPAMRDAATHDQLSERLRAANNQSPLVKHTPAEGKDPTKVSSGSLASRSDFMSYVGRATLLPKRAILHIPAAMAERIKLQPGSRIQTWADFYAANRGWITTVEVTRPQAEGNQPLSEELLKRIQKSTNVVVATYQSGPISVLPLKVPAETTSLPKP